MTTEKIKVAVIPVSGAASRVSDISNTVEKCLTPIITENSAKFPATYMVEACATAGIERVIFVTTKRGETQLRDHFDPNINPSWRELLTQSHKEDIIEAELQRRKSYGIAFEYMQQPKGLYGTTVPLLVAKAALAGEKRFALLGGDDFVHHPDGTSELDQAIKLWSAQGAADHVIMGRPVERSKASNYGIIRINSDSYMEDIDEKPPLGRVPENPIANISQYLFSDKIWDHVEEEMTRDRGQGEHYITYPLNRALAAGESILVHPITGHYIDGGSYQGLFAAAQYFNDLERAASVNPS